MIAGLVLVTLLGSPPDEAAAAQPEGQGAPEAEGAPQPQPQPELREPGTEPASEPRPGGFGTVSQVTTESTVQTVEPQPEPEPEASKRATEASGRITIGYGQTDVRNELPWDHRGASLGGVLQWYPYVTPRRRTFGIGIELGYAYQGLVRRKLPASADPAIEAPFTTSKVQQHFVDFGLALLVRPHPTWFSIQPTGAVAVAFYTGDDLYARERHANLPGRSSALGLAATLALCSAWDIVCVVGGYRWTDRLDANAVLDGRDFEVPTGTWHVGLGFDILRVYARLNGEPAAR